ncbi:MAG: response regulator [Planctomycetes bacterium]|nr:response regulator [Planctomycetota bacterium]
MRDKHLVLVVDDDHQIVEGLTIRLKAAGYDVLSANDGQPGIDAAIQNHPDAIVLDMRMPGMNGLAVLDELRARKETRDIPVVMLSANVADRAERQALDHGARYYLEKPYQAKAVIAALESAMAQHASRAPFAADSREKTQNGVWKNAN